MTLKVTIDNRTVEVEPGTTVLNAASEAGVYIPHLCYQRKLSIKGSCRVCLIEVEGTPKLQPACSTVVCEGMRVKTDTQQVRDSRRTVLELLLLNHPLDCPVCDAGGECKLQDYVFRYGNGLGRFEFDKRTYPREDIGPFVMRDMNRCIHCTRCVRFAAEVSLAGDIGVFERGDRTSIGPYLGRELHNPFSGNVAQLCPVGALTDRVFRFRARSWELCDLPSSCPLCSAGCLNVLQLRRGRLLRILSREKSRTPWICDLGRFGFATTNGEEVRPLLVEDGRRIEVPWDVATQTIAGRLRTILKESGPDSVGLVCGPLATNEEMFALRQVFRDALKCVNVSFGQCAPGPAGKEEMTVLRDALTAQSRIADLAGCDSLLLLCADPCEEVPVAGLRILQALGLASGGGGAEQPGKVSSAGVRIVALGPRRPAPAGLQLTWVAATPADCVSNVRDIALELAKTAGEARRTGQAAKPSAAQPGSGTLFGPEASGGSMPGGGPVPAGGLATRELDSKLGFWATSPKLGIVVGSDLLESPLVYGVMASVLRVCAARSVLGLETVPLFLFGRGNNRGAVELGILDGDSSPAGVNGGAGSHGSTAGYSGLSGVIQSAASGKLKALFIFGADLLEELRGRAEVEQALKRVEFLFVQSDRADEVAGMAHVYLPVQGIFDKKGSFMDLEGRLTGLSPQPSTLGEDSQLLTLLRAICQATGKSVELGSAEAIFSYMKRHYGWNLKEDLNALSLSEGEFPASGPGAGAADSGARPAGGETSRSEAWLGLREFEKGAAGRPPAEKGRTEPPTAESDAGQFLLLCGTAGVSQWVWAREVTSHPKVPASLFVEIPRADAERLDIEQGDAVEVSSAAGRVCATAAISDCIMPGVVFMPFGFPGEGPGTLTRWGDEVTAVRVEKAEVGAECSSSS